MILVTGASGTVGSEVVKKLKEKGVRVRAAFSSPAKAERARAEGLDAAVLDFGKPESLGPALAGVRKVVLLGATLPDQATLETNVVEAARAAGVGKIVKLSVWGAEGEEFGFARVHRQVEKAIEASGLPYTFLRPNGFMQNVANYYAATIKSHGAFYGSAGEARISHVDVRDIAAVAAEALTAEGHDGKAYLLSGPEALTYADVARSVSVAAGKPVSYVDMPDAELRKGMLGAGMPAFYADLLVDLIGYYRKGRAASISPDVERVTGRKPRSFDAFAAEHAADFR